MRPPDKFDMVDMEGIDLLAVQGEAIPGLYDKLVESITLCRYQCLYNWSFNGILIPPTYVEMEVEADGVWINEGVMVDEEDTVHIASIEPEPPAPVEPVIESLSITENGTYTAPTGVDGYSPVTVNVNTGGNLYTNYLIDDGKDNYKVTEASTVLAVLGGRTFTKVNSGAAYGAVMKVGNYCAPYLCSTEDPNYVKYQPPNSYTPKTLIKDGVTWYWMGGEYGMAVTPSTQTGALPNFNVSSPYATAQEAMSAFIDYFLSIPIAPLNVYKVSRTGVILPPSGYDGFGPLYIQ